ATARAIAPGADERVRDSRGIAIASPSTGEFTGIRTAPIRVEPGATYRAEVWLRTDDLVLPDPSVGATILALGLSLGPHPDADANARLDDVAYFSNRAVILEEVSSARSHAATTPWTRESIVVRTTRRIDHILIAVVMHGPQRPGARSGSARFDDLRVSQVVMPISALAPLGDHFTGAPHTLKKKARIAQDEAIAAAGASASARAGASEGAPARGDAHEVAPGEARKTEVAWNAIVAAAPGKLIFDTRIDAPSRLAFGYAIPPSLAAESGSVTFAIDVSARGREERLFEATLRPAVDESARVWRAASVDLARFAGQNVSIALITESEAGSGIGAALWGEPVIFPAPKASDAASARDAADTATRDASSGTIASAPRNVLLISIDTLRRDRLGCYGSPRRVSPELDRVARDGTLFEACVAPSSWTLPSHVSMHTGLSPSVHRVTGDEKRLGASRLTTAELLRRAGFATAGFVTHYYVSGDYGLDRGFESFTYHQELPAAAMCERAGDWIAAHDDRPFFCFVHLFDPHWDYAPPAPYAEVVGGRAARDYRGPVDGRFDPLQPWIDPATKIAPADFAHVLDLYDGEIAAVDAALGRLFARLDELGVADQTLVIVTSDHGEEFRDHGSFGHGHSLYEETVRVPLIVRAPGAAARVVGARAAAATIDIAPTIVAWAGIDSASVVIWIDEETRQREMAESAAGGGGDDAAPRADAGAGAISGGASSGGARTTTWAPEGRNLVGPPVDDTRTLLSETERFGTWRLALQNDGAKFFTPGHYVWWKGFIKGPEFYDLNSDPGEARNLVGLPAGRAAIPLGDQAVSVYLARHRGIVLVFRGDGGAHIARAQIAGARLLEPTAVGLEPTDIARQTPNGIEVALALSPSDSDILLIRSEHPETLRMNFAWDEARPAPGIVRIGTNLAPAEQMPIEFPPGRAAAPLPDPETIQLWDGPGVWILVSEEEAGTDFALDEEEIERLRALGYIQ
ncbi:MAG: sulfatase-like hydrolase/transferase, partial [bacterium]